MGAWIETSENLLIFLRKRVAPCMGAWIETYPDYRFYQVESVAPCMGAWIETGVGLFNTMDYMLSHPVWVRGLKQVVSQTVSMLLGRTLYGCVD